MTLYKNWKTMKKIKEYTIEVKMPVSQNVILDLTDGEIILKKYGPTKIKLSKLQLSGIKKIIKLNLLEETKVKLFTFTKSV